MRTLSKVPSQDNLYISSLLISVHPRIEKRITLNLRYDNFLNPPIHSSMGGSLRSGSGYEYVYNKDGKVVLKARAVMEEHLGHPLPKYVTVGYRNGDRTDCSIENLFLGLRAGIPLDNLICRECGTHGNFEIRGQES
jgi:hypothetical protein